MNSMNTRKTSGKIPGHSRPIESRGLSRMTRCAVSMWLVGMMSFGSGTAQASNATWLFSPGSGDWNTAANWAPALVPSGTATFGACHTNTITFSRDSSIGTLHFNAAGPAYFFNLGFSLTITGQGIVGDTGYALPTFSTLESIATLSFHGVSTAGGSFIENDDGKTQFFNTSSAGTSGLRTI